MSDFKVLLANQHVKKKTASLMVVATMDLDILGFDASFYSIIPCI